jgi:branched-chain amino acid transport system permease protein
MNLFWQILFDGFIISSIYAVGVVGFSLIFGTAGVLNLSHGAFLVLSAIISWFFISHFHLPLIIGMLCGILASVIVSYLLFILIINPIDKSKKIPNTEKEVFILTATLLWSMIIEELLDYFFSSNPVVVPPFVKGVLHLFKMNITYNEILLSIFSVIILIALWTFINKTKTGKVLLAASMSHDGLAISGIDIKKVYILLWGVYGILTGISGALLASFLGASAESVPSLTGLAFSVVVLGGLGNITGSILAAFLIGYIQTMTAYLISPAYTSVPAYIILVLILMFKPKGLFGRF